ncbi:hypothetical protein NHX12_028442 [Muraenolepis orangiensis]|uniref:Uncharacterized protein n=1 Tax=Muraenolepis orangiensis TaxID=630683 RepID=A0A9Q0EC59_9TELE|nr:hypothetical protein NHX12_028442 [Muraenolepis orangiensis]
MGSLRSPGSHVITKVSWITWDHSGGLSSKSLHREVSLPAFLLPHLGLGRSSTSEQRATPPAAPMPSLDPGQASPTIGLQNVTSLQKTTLDQQSLNSRKITTLRREGNPLIYESVCNVINTMMVPSKPIPNHHCWGACTIELP